MITGFRKSLVNWCTIDKELAPITFRIPISFFLPSAINIDKPSKPRLEITNVNKANNPNRLLNLASLSYCLIRLSSNTIYSKGIVELISFHLEDKAAAASGISFVLILT